MRLLLIGTDGLLGQSLVDACKADHDVRTLNPHAVPGRTGPQDLVGDPRDRDVAAAATRGCEAIVDLRAISDSHAATDLDRVDDATRGTYNLITTASAATRYILISSLRLFERYPIAYRVTEQWAPHPTTNVEDLACFLAEATVREVARVTPIKGIGLRLGKVVDESAMQSQPLDPRWLHVEDAVQAIKRALLLEDLPLMHIHPTFPAPRFGWFVFHIPGGGRYTRFPLALAAQPPFNYQPVHNVAPEPPALASQPAATEPHAARPTNAASGRPQRVVIFGAGGPVAAATSDELAQDHVLRLTDARPLAEVVASYRPQKPGAPVPLLLPPPHESRVVDVTDPDQVHDAVLGMDAIVNLSVNRHDPAQAFQVNTLGPYNIVRAAVAAGIRRFVQTGPQQVTHTGPSGYWDDFGLSDDLPGRPGAHLYVLTKFLGHEICRIFAEEHGLEIPLLLFSEFEHPTAPPEEPFGAFPFTVSWQDSAVAVRRALHAPQLPHPLEPFHITADLPHGKYGNAKAKTLLGWQPQDRLEAHWRRPEWPI